MRKTLKKLVAALLCVVLCASSLPVYAESEETVLNVQFAGITAQADGQWYGQALTGSFTAYQNGEAVGQIVIDETGEASLNLPGGGDVVLLPDMTTMPEGYLIYSNGYLITITQGYVNTAPLTVYADAGLFAIQAEGLCGFTLLDGAGQTVITFTTDETGYYMPPLALPSGSYTLRQDSAPEGVSLWPECALTLSAFLGDGNTIPVVNANYAAANALAAPEEQAAEASAAEAPVEETPAEETPAEETPAEEPPAETPAPEADKTASADALLEGIAAATGTLVFSADADAEFVLTMGESLAAQGVINAGELAVVPDLQPGEYMVTILIPEGMAMVSLNGYPLALAGVAQWESIVGAGSEGLYEIGFTELYSIFGTVPGAEGAIVTAQGGAEPVAAAVTNGAFVLDGLLPGSYTVTMTLPRADYVGEGWTVNYLEQGVEVSAQAEVSADVVLPALNVVADASVSGKAVELNGTPIASATVTLTDAAGTALQQTTTAEDGSWAFTGLGSGSYKVHVDYSGADKIVDALVSLEPSQQLANVTMTSGDPAKVEINVFVDGNNNGKKGKFEDGFGGVTLELVPAAEPQGPAVATAVSNGMGNATFANVAPGEYVLRAETPVGYGFAKHSTKTNSLDDNIMQPSDLQTQTSAAFKLQSGKSLKCGVALRSFAIVSGYIWVDDNADGIRQESEGGYPGWKVELVKRGGSVEYEAVTDEYGNYFFGNVAGKAEYNIRVFTPDGMVFTRYSKTGGYARSILTAAGTNKALKLVELDQGDVLENQNIGFTPESKIQVQCFLDANYNGYYDEGDLPMKDVEADLIRQGSSEKMMSAKSGEDGVITFGTLRANTYRVQVKLPKGTYFTVATTGDKTGNQFKATDGKRTDTVDNLVLGSGLTLQLVAGAVQPSTVSGVVYFDDNFSAVQDKREKVAAGLSVSLVDASGKEIDTAKTKQNGRYTFENVNPGTYTLSLNAKNGYAFTKLGDQNVIVNKTGGAGVSNPFDVTLDSKIDTMDIGMIRPGIVQGLVFGDGNDNGVLDDTEYGLIGTKVRLMSEEGEWFSATIEANGLFYFDAVMPGRYYLEYELPERGVFCEVVKGDKTNNVPGEGRIGKTDWFDFKTGDNYIAALCGGLVLGEVSGNVFHDLNGSGMMDEGEKPLSGVTLTMTPTREGLTAATATTGEDGAFVLSSLRPDDYTLTVTYPEGMVSSRMVSTALPVYAGQREQSTVLSVLMGSAWIQQELGGAYPASITGSFWLDENLDGVHGGDEYTPAGETVYIVDEVSGMVYSTLTTDETGFFGADNLIPGSYTVAYVLGKYDKSAPKGDSIFAEAEGKLVVNGVMLNEGDAASGFELGVARYTAIGGTAWVDQGGEFLNLAGASITICNGEGNELGTLVTEDDGVYRFVGLLPGTYELKVTLPEGLVVVESDDVRITQGNMVSAMNHYDGRTGSTGPIEVLMGRDMLELNVGGVIPGKLGDMAWLDLNANGLQDSGEGGIPGVTVQLMRDGEVKAETVTDQYGYYLFTGVYPAAYTLRVTAPEEVEPTQQREDFKGIVSVLGQAEEGVAESIEVTVTSAESNYAADLGFVLKKKDAYPAGYGEGATQDWTKIPRN